MIDIDTKDLIIGMFVEHLDRPWLESPFLFHGFLIENQRQIEQLQLLTKAVKIDEKKSLQALNDQIKTQSNASRKHADIAPATTAPQSNKERFAEEMAMANAVYDTTWDTLKNLLINFRTDQSVTFPELEACVQSVLKNIKHTPNTLLLVASMRQKRQDTVTHSLNSCIFSALLGRHLGFHDEQLTQLCIAAILHDVGETKIPKAILDKHNIGLSPEEKKLIELHTLYGAEMLRNIPNIPAEIAEVALSHHERVDGKGYPRGLGDSEISLMSRIITIIDAYEQVTNSNDPQTQLSSADAIKAIYAMSDSCFDSELVEAFIKCLGLYPIGTLIQLNDGTMGAVVGIKPDKHLLPFVMVVREPNGKLRHPPRLINLDRLRDQNNNPLLIINRVLQPKELGIDLSDYIDKEFGNHPISHP